MSALDRSLAAPRVNPDEKGNRDSRDRPRRSGRRGGRGGRGRRGEEGDSRDMFRSRGSRGGPRPRGREMFGEKSEAQEFWEGYLDRGTVGPVKSAMAGRRHRRAAEPYRPREMASTAFRASASGLNNPSREEREWKRTMYRPGGEEIAEPEPTLSFAALSGGSKIIVTNMDLDVDAPALRDVFSEVGAIRSITIGKDGKRPDGTATISFQASTSAAKAVKEFDGAEIEGADGARRPIFVKVVNESGGIKVIRPRVARKSNGGMFGQALQDAREDHEWSSDVFNRPARRNQNPFGGRQREERPFNGFGRGGRSARGRGNRGNGRGRNARGGNRSNGNTGRGPRRQPKKEVTKEELDAELDSWRTPKEEAAAPAPVAGSEDAGAEQAE